MKFSKQSFKKLALILPATPLVTLLAKKLIGKEVKNLPITDVDVQNCIDNCTQAAQKIRTIANDIVDHRARYALTEADRHIELCIHGCLDAKAITRS